MKVKREDIIELNHVLESGKENFPFETSFRDVVELDPNGNARAHAEKCRSTTSLTARTVRTILSSGW